MALDIRSRVAFLRIHHNKTQYQLGKEISSSQAHIASLERKVINDTIIMYKRSNLKMYKKRKKEGRKKCS